MFYNYFCWILRNLFHSHSNVMNARNRGWVGGGGMGNGGEWAAGGGLYLLLGNRQQCCVFSE